MKKAIFGTSPYIWSYLVYKYTFLQFEVICLATNLDEANRYKDIRSEM